MITSESKMPFDYNTIKVTQSRIGKGLLAIPVSLLDYFPKKSTQIEVFAGNAATSTPKTFTPYSSSSGECRIGGMRDFYREFSLQDGDEIVVQMLPDGKYRLIAERQLSAIVQSTEKHFDTSTSEDEAISTIKKLSTITNRSTDETLRSEFSRVSKSEVTFRKVRRTRSKGARESAPPSIRRLLAGIYGGKCQVTGFGFTMRNGKPYFEVHHLRPNLGNHLKNILVVSPNTHAQFTHALVEEHFDGGGWLRRVVFNGTPYAVSQFIDKIPDRYHKEVHSDN